MVNRRTLQSPFFSILRTTLRKKQPAERTTTAKLPNVWVLTKNVINLLYTNRWLFLGIAGIYTILNILLVRGLSGAVDLTALKNSIAGTGGSMHLLTSLTLFGVLVTASGSKSSDVAGAYQTILLIITSLAIIWALRQVLAIPPTPSHSKIRIRDSFYLGMYPLVPVLLVVIVMFLQLIPLLIGAFIFGTVLSNGIATNLFEKSLWAIIFIAGLSLTLYWLASSIFAGYIATLPDMTPMKALRSARDLVRYRRLSVIRKLLFLPLGLLIASAAILLPIIFFATPVAQWVYFALSMVAIVIVHSYLYSLYRELLK